MNFVVTDPTRVINILESAGYEPKLRDIIQRKYLIIRADLTRPKAPEIAGVNVEYVYSCIAAQGAENNSIVLLGVNDIESAHNALARDGSECTGKSCTISEIS